MATIVRVTLSAKCEPVHIVVCHCFRENEITVRIISARKADKDEENV